MILALFLSLIGISTVLIALGYSMTIDALRFGGFALLFLLSLVMLFGSVEYVSGYTITVTGDITTITSDLVTITQASTLFSTITFHVFAFIFAIASVFGFIFVFVDRKQED